MIKVLITGGAGFIGSSLADYLVQNGKYYITVLDNFDDFYSKKLKLSNINHNLNQGNYLFVETDIRNYDDFSKKLTGDFDMIIHLAAKAGVRQSILNPVEYQQVNIQGTQNLLEYAKNKGVKHFVFGSSSSVYGINPNVPWKEHDYVLQPISPYAATKVAGELLGHVYSKLYGIRFLALRFFTVFGPRQRPDLAIHKFTKLILEKKKIPVFGDGSTSRDYTYVDDIIYGIVKAMDYHDSMYEIINLGNNKTIKLIELISSIENTLGMKANIDFQPEQPGDVSQTFADISKAKRLLGYIPKTDLNIGLSNFVNWYKEIIY